jgi:hypothetical protein
MSHRPLTNTSSLKIAAAYNAHIGAFPNKLHYKTPFLHKGLMKVKELYENYRTMHGILPKVIEITI